MAKQFGGFTPQQKEVLARKMGFKGPMEKFGEFIQASPQHMTKYQSYENKAKQLVAGSAPQTVKPPVGFAEGGDVDGSNQEDRIPTTSSNTTTTTTTGTTTAPPTLYDQVAASPGQALTQELLTNPEATVTPVKVDNIKVEDDQFIDPNSGQVAAGPDVTAATGSTTLADGVTATAAPQVTTALSAPGVEAATAGMTAAQGTVSDGSQVVAATALPSANATVQGQLEQLMADFEGGETPAWAAGAIRAADAAMASRGLGSSSMAGASVTQAAMESAILIAAQDAATYSQFEMQNLNNTQQARLQNAQAFLTMDLANLEAEQQMEMFKSQSVIQSLFTDQAAENASQQFNASSQAQTDQFFASLSSQVSQFNASQSNAMEQFNAGQTNSVSMFNRQMNDARDQFNATNRLIIDQSNAEWRRAVTTSDNAAINEANRINAQSATGLTTAAYNNLMQTERDLYSFAFTTSENALQRAHELTVAQMQIKAGADAAAGEALGALAGTVVSGIFSTF